MEISVFLLSMRLFSFFSTWSPLIPICCLQKSGCGVKSKFFEQGLSNSPEEKSGKKESVPSIKLPPPPPAPLSPVIAAHKSPTDSPTKLSLEKTSEVETPKTVKEDTEHENSPENQSTQDVPDDDFGDFQAAG